MNDGAQREGARAYFSEFFFQFSHFLLGVHLGAHLGDKGAQTHGMCFEVPLATVVLAKFGSRFKWN